MGKGDKPQKAVRIEILLKGITWLGAFFQFISVIFPNLIWSFPTIVAVQTAGIILGVVSILFFISSITIMRNNWRAGFDKSQNTELVTDGIYKISRNPAFVGFDLLYIGCSVAFPNILNIIFSISAIIVFHVQILGEEKFLMDMFGKQYLDYKAKVRRYI